MIGSHPVALTEHCATVCGEYVPAALRSVTRGAEHLRTVAPSNGDRTPMLSWIGNLETTARDVLFIDRDGVLNLDRPDYVKNWKEFQFYPDALLALRWLNQRHVAVIVISNQSALHRGYTDWDSFWHLHHAMVREVRRTGGDILAAYYCPHRPDEDCSCRKPSPAMLLSAARMFGVVPASTAMVGDRHTDMRTARKAGCRAILLNRLGAHPDAPGPLDTEPTVSDDEFTSLLEAVQALFSKASN